MPRQETPVEQHWREREEREVERQKAATTTITVTVEGGLVQCVEGIPPGVTVRVLDFDIEGSSVDVIEVVGSAFGSLAMEDVYTSMEQIARAEETA